MTKHNIEILLAAIGSSLLSVFIIGLAESISSGAAGF
jgi:hypothetical protein